MKIFFLLLHPGYTRNFESVVKALVQRGHNVTLGFNALEKEEDRSLLPNLATMEGVKIIEASVPKRVDKWRFLLRFIYGLMDGIRYFDPQYDDADLLRQRVITKIPHGIFTIFKWGFGLRNNAIRTFWLYVLRLICEAAPPAKNIGQFLSSERPDLLLMTPMVNFQSEQVEWVKSARQLGIPSILCVASWDNLTNKGLIRIQPDKVLVWNEFQKQEAIDLHMIAPDQVVVTGAQCFDKWFAMTPSTTFSEFCEKVGFSSPCPYLLYVASSPFIGQKDKEVEFVRDWIEAVRNSSVPELNKMNILIRPHPQNAEPWKNADFSAFQNVLIYPRAGANPINDKTRAEFYDSLYHSYAVVGLNTTAMIEAGILNKPVFTILDPRFKGTQEGTLHFRYLVREGLIDIAEDFYQHINQLERLVRGKEARTARIRQFIERFLRPKGINQHATDIFVDEIEQAPATLSLLHHSTNKAFMLWIFRLGAMPFAYAFSALVKIKELGFAKFMFFIFLKLSWRLAVRVLHVFDMKDVVKDAIIAQFHIAGIGTNGRRAKETFSDQDIHKKLRKVARSSDSVVIGPWMSEVGFEVLYWIPFLHWVVEKYKLDPQRLLIVSRGGSHCWYGALGQRYVDIFDFLSEEEFRAINEKRWQATRGQKQIRLTTDELELVEAMRAREQLAQIQILHPSQMYWLFRSFWRGWDSYKFYQSYTRIRPFAVPSCAEEICRQLPPRYVAVRFYFRPSFPDTPQNRQFIVSVIKQISKRQDVVLLNPDIKLDDHDDFEYINDRVYTIAHHMTPRNNLEVQSAVISRAQAFIGTYGGLSYIAPFYDVPSIAFYSDARHFLPVHLETSQRIFRELNVPFLAISTSHYSLVEDFFGPSLYSVSASSTYGIEMA